MLSLVMCYPIVTSVVSQEIMGFEQLFIILCFARHQKAIETAKKTIKLIEEMYNSILAICKEKSYQS